MIFTPIFALFFALLLMPIFAAFDIFRHFAD